MTLERAYGGERPKRQIPFSSYGELVTSGAVTGHVLWPNGPDLNVPAVGGVQMSVQSTNAADASPSGTGIRSVILYYLDVNLTEKIEVVQLNGTTPVLTVATDMRFIQCMHLVTYGSDKKAAGIITATNGGKTYSYIAAGRVRCSSSARMVPAGYELNINTLYGGSTSTTSDAEITLRFFATKFGTFDFTQDGIMFPLGAVSSQNSTPVAPGLYEGPFLPGTVVGLQCDASKSATVTGGFFGKLQELG